MLISTKEDFYNFSRFSSNSNFHSSTSDEATIDSSSFEKDSTDSDVKSLDVQIFSLDPPDFELSSASFDIDFDEKSFENRLEAAASHLMISAIILTLLKLQVILLLVALFSTAHNNIQLFR